VYHTDNMFYLGFRLKLDIAVLNSQLPKAQMFILLTNSSSPSFYSLKTYIIMAIAWCSRCNRASKAELSTYKTYSNPLKQG